ncbi:MAG TPA: hypothetical protein VNL98_12300 [Gemmatimonadales bacterium]|nr:hypothetical protein [Gemmatimonadales bacterium]
MVTDEKPRDQALQRLEIPEVFGNNRVSGDQDLEPRFQGGHESQDVQ